MNSQIIRLNRYKPLQMQKITIMVIFFSVNFTSVVQELKDRKKLSRFIGIHAFQQVKVVYGIIRKIDVELFISLIPGILNSW